MQKGSIYLYKHSERRLYAPYSRLKPTWGLSRASRDLQNKAQGKDLCHEEIKRALSHYPRLASRLCSRGVEICKLSQGVSQEELASFFRAMLYQSRNKEKFGAAGWQIMEDKPEYKAPYFSAIHHCLRQPDGFLLDTLIEDFQAKASFLFRTVRIMQQEAFANNAMLVSGLGFSLLFAWFRPVIDLLYLFTDFDSETLGHGFDALVGLVSGVLVVGVPSILAMRSYGRMQQDLLSGPAWRALNNYAENTEVDQKEARRAAQIIQFLQPKSCKDYLSNLNYQKISLLAKVYDDKDTLNEALLSFEETPLPEIKSMLHDENKTISLKAFDRVKEQLTPSELEELLAHRLPELRLGSFQLLIDQAEPEKLIKYAIQLENTPEILTMEGVPHQAKVASVKATAVNKCCAKLLREFAKIAQAADLEDIFSHLVDKESYAAMANLDQWIGLIIDRDDISPTLLFKIAKGNYSLKKSFGAMLYLMKGRHLDSTRTQALRFARSNKVRACASFCDEDSGTNELVIVLKDLISREIDESDVLLARKLLMYRHGGQRREIIYELMKSWPKLAQKLNSCSFEQ